MSVWFTDMTGQRADVKCPCGRLASTWAGGQGLPALPICNPCATNRVWTYDLRNGNWTSRRATPKRSTP